MGKEIKVNIGKSQRWMKLALYMQNSPHESFRIKCDDQEKARATYNRLRVMISYERPTWFNLVVCLRGSDIYVIKQDRAQKVVIQDGQI